MRILVTDVSGFVGGALGAFLRDHGHAVTGLSRRPPRERATDEFRSVDLTRSLPSDLGAFDVVVHAAALASPWARPEAFRQHNVEPTERVLELAARAGAQHFVFISSSSVYYAQGDQIGICETTPLPPTPINAYSGSKREAEALVRTSSLATLILRPCAVFGVGDTVLFPRILRASRIGLLPHFKRTDGSRAIGDLISIDNLVHFIAAAIDRRITGEINLTDGQPVDIYEFLGRLLRKLGLPPPRWSVPVPVAMKIAGAMESVSSTLLGWREPPLTKFGVGVFSQSKTFDIGLAMRLLGPPPVSTETALDRFVAWQKARPI